MDSFRLPRFKREPSVAPPQLTERDREIIRHVYRHRFLRSSHICSLVAGSQQQILRRLKLLYHHGYLARPRAQIDYYHQGGSREIVYGLGNKSASILKPELGEMFRQTPWDEENGSVKGIFLQHALLVSDIMVALALACRESGVCLLTEQDLATANRPFRWNMNVAGQKLSAVPDRVFALEFQGADSNPRRSYFFLEADRGTMPVIRKSLVQTSFYRKLLAYEATWTHGIHEKQFGFHRFRVLTVTTSPLRVKSLIDACFTLKSGHGLFLFTDRSVLDNPQKILSHIWQTGRPGETGTLLD